jgi:hypothetical protein
MTADAARFGTRKLRPVVGSAQRRSSFPLLATARAAGPRAIALVPSIAAAADATWMRRSADEEIGMSTHRKADIIRAVFAAYLANDRKAVENALTDDFRFTSPYDDHIDKATYFERCWRNTRMPGFFSAASRHNCPMPAC